MADEREILVTLRSSSTVHINGVPARVANSDAKVWIHPRNVAAAFGSPPLCHPTCLCKILREKEDV